MKSHHTNLPDSLVNAFKKIEIKKKKEKEPYELFHGDCLEELKKIPSHSIDAMVTDPPAGISFMGKDWDKDKGGRDEWISWLSGVMTKCRRVLKPGAHIFVWAIPRTSHWTATAIEDAGFEIRDIVTHVFGQGFPKNLNVGNGLGTALKPAAEMWILARKPLADENIAKNVMMWNTGAINIDECRINTKENLNGGAYCGGVERKRENYSSTDIDAKAPLTRLRKGIGEYNQPQGRFPSNFILSHHEECELIGKKKIKAITGGGLHLDGANKNSWYKNAHQKTKTISKGNVDGTETIDNYKCHPECPVKMLDKQSGITKTGDIKPHKNMGSSFQASKNIVATYAGDSGGASRFYYCAKPAATEKDKGLSHFTKAKARNALTTHNGAGDYRGVDKKPLAERANFHPTSKSVNLMRYLCRLVTPPMGVVIDPFMGGGSTGVAALKEGFRFIGIEQSEEYFKIAKNRIIDADYWRRRHESKECERSMAGGNGTDKAEETAQKKKKKNGNGEKK